jgi:ribosomal protein L11 methylase PrmA
MALRLNRFGQAIKDNLQNNRPAMHEELKQSGNLDSFLRDQQDRMSKEFGNLLQKGFSEDEAMEMLRPDYLQEQEEQEEQEEDATSKELTEQNREWEKNWKPLFQAVCEAKRIATNPLSYDETEEETTP